MNNIKTRFDDINAYHKNLDLKLHGLNLMIKKNKERIKKGEHTQFRRDRDLRKKFVMSWM